MAQDSREYRFRKWNIRDGSVRVLDVREMAKLTLHARQSTSSPNAWSPDIDVKWASYPDGRLAQAFGTPITVTTAAPTEMDIDVTGKAYVVLSPATAAATDQYLDIDGLGKSQR